MDALDDGLRRGVHGSVGVGQVGRERRALPSRPGERRSGVAQVELELPADVVVGHQHLVHQ